MRYTQPQSGPINLDTLGWAKGATSVLLPLLKGVDLVSSAPSISSSTGINYSQDRFEFATTTSKLEYNDTKSAQFRNTVFTKVIKFRLKSLSNGFIYTSDSRFTIGIGVEGITSGQLGVSWYDGAFKQISFTPALDIDYTLVIPVSATGVSLYANGKLIGATASGPIVYAVARGTAYGYVTFFSLSGTVFDLHMSSYSRYTMTDDEAKKVSSNPWLIFLDNKKPTLKSSLSTSILSGDGNSAGSASATAVLVAFYRSQAAAVGASTQSGAGNALASSSASSVGITNVNAVGNNVFNVGGASSNLASATGASSIIWCLNGNALGSSSVNSSTQSLWSSSGSSSGVSSLSANANYKYQSQGSVSGTSIVLGTGSDAASGNTVISGDGSSLNVSLVIGYASATASSLGNSSGLSASQVTGACLVGSAGNSAGTGYAASNVNVVFNTSTVSQGSSVVQAVVNYFTASSAISYSMSTVSAVSNCIKSVIGFATANSTAQATSQGGVHYTEIGDRFAAKYQPPKYVLTLTPKLQVTMKVK